MTPSLFLHWQCHVKWTFALVPLEGLEGQRPKTRMVVRRYCLPGSPETVDRREVAGQPLPLLGPPARCPVSSLFWLGGETS